MQPRPVDLTELINRVVDQIRPFIQVRNLQLHTQLADDLGSFEIDADKVHAVLINLLTNAIKFTPDGGSIELVARLADGDSVEISVEDHGVGLEPTALELLFQPFFTQLDPSRHSSGDFGFCKRGLGLGLCIAKQFVELHGGQINAESRAGAGTRVTVRLPRHARAARGSPPQNGALAQNGGDHPAARGAAP